MNYKKLYQQSQLAINRLIEATNEQNSYPEINPHKALSDISAAYTTLLTARDKSMCASRFEWKTPLNLTSQQIEGFLYLRGSLCIFRNEQGVVQFADYATVGQLNPYGWLTKIKPIDFAGHTHESEYTVINRYGENAPEDGRVAIIVQDYSGAFNNDGKIVPRIILNTSTTIDDQAQVFAQMYNNILLTIKRALALCENEDQKSTVVKEAKQILYNANPIVPIIAKQRDKGGIEQPLEMFNFDHSFDTQNYCQTIDFYDKFRRKCNGLPCPDIFEKKERMISSETENSDADSQFVLYDGLMCRKNAVKLANKYLKADLAVDYSEVIRKRNDNAKNMPVNAPKTDETDGEV